MKLQESAPIFTEINKIISTGLKKSVDLVAKGIHDYAANSIPKVKRGSPEFQILSKIVSNPFQITKQLIRSAIDKDKSADKNASSKDPNKDDVPTLNDLDQVLADITM
jgi:hypothetical protein